jgi:hypothetical protein
MTESDMTFRRGVIRPGDCLSQGWQLIKADYWTFLGVTFVGMLLGSLAPLAILMGPMMCGIYLCLLGRQRGQEPSMNLLFKGFDYFVQSLIATLVMVVPMLVVMVPAYIAMFVFLIKNDPAFRGNMRGQAPPPPPDLGPFFAVFGVFWLLFIVVSIVIGVFFIFTYPLIVDRRLSGIDAIKTSFKAAAANLGGVVGVVLLNMAISMLGLMCCYIGALFVMPLGFAAVSIAYRQVFPENWGDEPLDPIPGGPASTGIQSR